MFKVLSFSAKESDAFSPWKFNQELINCVYPIFVIVLPVVVSTSPCISKSALSLNSHFFLVAVLINDLLSTLGVVIFVGSEYIVANSPGFASSNASTIANGYSTEYFHAFSTGAPSPNLH